MIKRGLLSLFFTSSAFAASPATLFQGSFFFGGVKPLDRTTVDIVDTRMSDAQMKLANLREKGALCTYAASNTYKCITHEGAGAVPPESLQEAYEANQKLKIEFGAVSSSPSLIVDAESVTEWQINQDVFWTGGQAPFYRQMILDGEILKVILGEGPEALWLVGELNDSTKLSMRASVVHTTSRWQWHEDAIEILLKQ